MLEEAPKSVKTLPVPRATIGRDERMFPNPQPGSMRPGTLRAWEEATQRVVPFQALLTFPSLNERAGRPR